MRSVARLRAMNGNCLSLRNFSINDIVTAMGTYLISTRMGRIDLGKDVKYSTLLYLSKNLIMSAWSADVPART